MVYAFRQIKKVELFIWYSVGVGLSLHYAIFFVVVTYTVQSDWVEGGRRIADVEHCLNTVLILFN